MRSTGGMGLWCAAAACALVVPIVLDATRSPAAVAEPANVVISEFMASNASTITDDDGDHSDWLELWNPTSSAVDLSGWHLTDNHQNTVKWTIPSLTMPPDAYVVVWASSKNRSGVALHTNFALSAGGEYLAITDPLGTVVHEYSPTFPAQVADRSYGIGSDQLTGFLSVPTPGGSNSVTGIAERPAFDHPAGFYTSAIQLSMTTPEAASSIRYTTDGSSPSTSHGETYSEPINVSSTSVVRAITLRAGFAPSKITTATYLFVDDIVTQSSLPAGWPSGPVNQQLLDYGMDPEVVGVNRAGVISGLLALPSISIAMDVANLVDPTTGIYVNAKEQGAEWERPVSVELIGSDAAASFNIAAGLRIRGNFSRTGDNPKHSLRLTFGPAYGGALDRDLFGDGVDHYTALDLRTEQNYAWQYGNDRNTMLREVWNRSTQADLGGLTTRSMPVHLYLNGQYWGVYQLQQRINDDFAAESFGGDPDDYDIVKHGPPATELEDGSIDAWHALWVLINDLHVTDEELAVIHQKVDLAALADYTLLRIYAGESDGTNGRRPDKIWGNNWYGVRSDDDAQRWVFAVTDAEHTLGARDHDVTVDVTGSNGSLRTDNPDFTIENFHPGWLHEALVSNPAYRALFRTRVSLAMTGDGALTPQAGLDRWLALKAVVSPAVIVESARWGDVRTIAPLGLSEWNAEVSWVENEWFPQRTAIVLQQLAAVDLAALPGNFPITTSIETEGLAPANRVGTVTS